MCYVTATELKQNLSYYLELSTKESVYITKNKKVICALVDPRISALEDFLKLKGCMADPKYEGKSTKEIVGEAILKKCTY